MNANPMKRHPFRQMRKTGGMETTSRRHEGMSMATRKSRIGSAKANAIVIGGSSSPLTNAPPAASHNARPNQTRVATSNVVCLEFMRILDANRQARCAIQILPLVDLQGYGLVQ